jgi:quinol-cytochrome oxidoreductase complex cytochrome b subunit
MTASPLPDRTAATTPSAPARRALAALRGVLDRPVERKRLLFLDLGRLGVFLFAVLAVTGVLLGASYEGTAAGAHESLVTVTDSVRFGWFVRGLHRITGHALVLVAGLYVARGFFRRLFLRPRGALAWPVAVGFAFVCLAFLLTGESLPWSQDAYWQTVVNTSLVEQLPLCGPWLADALRGGSEVGDATVVRIYALHVLVLPWVAVALLVRARDLRRRGDLA